MYTAERPIIGRELLTKSCTRICVSDWIYLISLWQLNNTGYNVIYLIKNCIDCTSMITSRLINFILVQYITAIGHAVSIPVADKKV